MSYEKKIKFVTFIPKLYCIMAIYGPLNLFRISRVLILDQVKVFITGPVAINLRNT